MTFSALIPPTVSCTVHSLGMGCHNVTFSALIHPYIIMYCTLSRDGVLHPSLEAILSNPSLFKELHLEGPNEEVFSLFGEVYGREAVKGVHELLKKAIPFKMAATVSVSSLLFLHMYILFCFAYIFASSV